MRLLLTILGGLAVALAAIGAFLPLVPTTPFLLLAAACFARASPRLQQALLSNRLFGPYLYDFEVNKGLKLRTKIVALVMLWSSMSVSIYIVPNNWLKAFLCVIGLSVSAYIVFRLKTLPARPKSPAAKNRDGKITYH